MTKETGLLSGSGRRPNVLPPGENFIDMFYSSLRAAARGAESIPPLQISAKPWRPFAGNPVLRSLIFCKTTKASGERFRPCIYDVKKTAASFQFRVQRSPVSTAFSVDECQTPRSDLSHLKLRRKARKGEKPLYVRPKSSPVARYGFDP
jgi:hypothetical protein